MLRNQADNYAADEERGNDLPSDPQSDPTAAMVDWESDLEIVDQKKASGRVGKRDSSRKVLISFDYHSQFC
jgi:hypothetical protein